MESFGKQPTARWEVPMTDGMHIIEFNHGTATGRRVVKIDGKLIVNREWMFRLVGDEVVTFGDIKFIIKVKPISGLRYSYSLWINNKSFKNFIQSQSKILKTWTTHIDQNEYRIILDINTQAVWINGEQVESESNFIDDGAEIQFIIADLPGVIALHSSGQRDFGINYILNVNGVQITEEESDSTVQNE